MVDDSISFRGNYEAVGLPSKVEGLLHERQSGARQHLAQGGTSILPARYHVPESQAAAFAHDVCCSLNVSSSCQSLAPRHCCPCGGTYRNTCRRSLCWTWHCQCSVLTLVPICCRHAGTPSPASLGAHRDFEPFCRAFSLSVPALTATAHATECLLVWAHSRNCRARTGALLCSNKDLQARVAASL